MSDRAWCAAPLLCLNMLKWCHIIISDWGLRDVQRSDIKQADIANLMSALLGVPVPLNSVGVVPLDYLDVSLSDKAEIIYTNARQMLEQFHVKLTQKQDTTLSLLFTPYK